jgi:HAD superfamily hydrolase (TIGR01548 family)
VERLPVDAILFDLDGTLIDESASYREVIRLTAEYLLRAPVDPAEVEEVKRLPGTNNDWDATWALMNWRQHGSISPPDPIDRSSHAFRRLQDVFQTYYLGDALWSEISGRAAPFVWREPLIRRERPLIDRSLLAWLGDFPVGIATSRPRIEALMALRQHGLDRLFGEDVLVAAEDAPCEKPHPAPLQTLAARLSCRQAVYVGDTINDALAAFTAGMAFIHVGAEPLTDAAIEARVRYRVASVNDIMSICVPIERDVASPRSLPRSPRLQPVPAALSPRIEHTTAPDAVDRGQPPTADGDGLKLYATANAREASPPIDNPAETDT